MGGVFSGGHAFVTGASRGIGQAIARMFAREGARVSCAASRAQNAAGTVAEIRAAGGEAEALGVDVAAGGEVSAAFERAREQFGPVTVVVNNAGISEPGLTLDMSERDWDRHMDINCKSVFLCSQAGARQMQDNGGGVIVNIGSILGRNAFPATLGYCASKAALDQMTRVMAIEWARLGIRVNCVAPGYVYTEMIDRLEADGKLTVRDLERRTPQRRLGSVEDVANAVRFVASDDAGFMTGETLIIDGGWNAFGYYQPGRKPA